MSKAFARKFYSSQAWVDCREAYKASVGGLCERCKERGLIVPGEIVHHKIHLTPDTIHDPAVSLAWDNLELVCRECHAEEHGATRKRYEIDELGRVVGRD